MILLPLHVFNRELDSRILLSCKLASMGHDAIICTEHGSDHVFDQLGIGDAALVGGFDISFFENRYLKGLLNGLSLYIVSEEGINDCFAPGYKKQLGNMVNENNLTKSIRRIFTWSEKENEVFGKIFPNVSRDKIVDSVNPRFDLLGKTGLFFFAELTAARETLFSNYILVIDNFGGEPRSNNGSYIPLGLPSKEMWSHDIDDIDAHSKQLEETLIKDIEMKKKRRECFVSNLKKLVREYSHINFIIRPHPICSPNYWCSHFGEFANCHISQLDSFESWLFGAQCVINDGCTTGLQAHSAHKPSINVNEISVPYTRISDLCTFNMDLTIAASTIDDVLATDVDNYESRWQRAYLETPNISELKNYWTPQFNFTDIFSRIIDEECPNRGKKINDISINLSRFRVEPTKGRRISRQELEVKVRGACAALKINRSTLKIIYPTQKVPILAIVMK